MLKDAVPVLMESAPPEVNVSRITDAMKLVGLVHQVHHVLVWQLDEHHRALEAHVMIDRAMADEFDQVKRQLKHYGPTSGSSTALSRSSS